MNNILYYFIFLLSLASTSNALIIYTKPAEKIPIFAAAKFIDPEQLGQIQFFQRVVLDINNDAILDFELFGEEGPNGLDLIPLNNNRIIATPNSPPDIGSLIEPLDTGFHISTGLAEPFVWYDSAGGVSACVNIGCIGKFVGKTAYMGLEFQIDNKTHYGWMQFEDISAGGWVLDWAYETEPGKGINAGTIPEPSTYMMILIGIIMISFAFRGKGKMTR